VEKRSRYKRLYFLETLGKCGQTADDFHFKLRTVFIYYNCDGARLWDRRGNEYAIRSWERNIKEVRWRRKRNRLAR
jgi:hypothetical protein